MKFGKLLKLNTLPEWKDFYFDYKGLKALVERLQVLNKKRETLRDSKHREQEKHNKAEREREQREKQERHTQAVKAAAAIAAAGGSSGMGVPPGLIKRSSLLVSSSSAANSSVATGTSATTTLTTPASTPSSISTTPALGLGGGHKPLRLSAAAGGGTSAVAGAGDNSPLLPGTAAAALTRLHSSSSSTRGGTPRLAVGRMSPAPSASPIPTEPSTTTAAPPPALNAPARSASGVIIAPLPLSSIRLDSGSADSDRSPATTAGAAATAAAQRPELTPLMQLTTSSAAIGRSPVIAAAVAGAAAEHHAKATAASVRAATPQLGDAQGSGTGSGTASVASASPASGPTAPLLPGVSAAAITSTSPLTSFAPNAASTDAAVAAGTIKAAVSSNDLKSLAKVPSPVLSVTAPIASSTSMAAGKPGGSGDVKESLEEQERKVVQQITALRTEFFTKLDREIKKVTEFFNTQLTKFQSDWKKITDDGNSADELEQEPDEHTAMLPVTDAATTSASTSAAAAATASGASPRTGTPGGEQPELFLFSDSARPLSTKHSNSAHRHTHSHSHSRSGNESTKSLLRRPQSSSVIAEFKKEGVAGGSMRDPDDGVPWYRRLCCCEDDFTYSPVAGRHSPQSPTHKAVHAKLERLLSLYRHSLQLQAFREINFLGVSKIVKKYDKNMNESHRVAVVARYSTAELHRSVELEELISQVEEHYSTLAVELAIAQNKDVTAAVAMIKRVRAEVSAKTNQQIETELYDHVKPLWLGVSLALGALVWLLPILQAEPHAHRCLVLLTFITSLWVTEAIPYFVSALCIPVLVVWMEILQDGKGESLDADTASRVTFANFFDDTSALVLGGFAIAAAFNKCQFELKIADVMQTHFGHRPSLFLFVLMSLGFFLSMWISNVAAPLLCTAVLTPFIHDLPKSHPYARALLLGLAFACNLGGMLSPISSPQNAIALGYLEGTQPEHAITFMQWILISVPVCSVCLVISWIYLNFVVLGRDGHLQSLPEIFYEEKKMTTKHYMVLAISAGTITLWCTLSYTKEVLGQMGVVAMVPLVVFFATGILEKNDLGKFSWNLLLLIGGGHVLGGAVTSSKLLDVLTSALEPALEDKQLWVSAVAMVSVVFLISTFVSHTVCALILMPLIVSLGSRLHHTRTLVTVTTLMMSGTMSLPMSSFPNVNSLLIEDDNGTPYLHSVDFLKHGTPIALVTMVMICTIGFVLVESVFAIH